MNLKSTVTFVVSYVMYVKKKKKMNLSKMKMQNENFCCYNATI